MNGRELAVRVGWALVHLVGLWCVGTTEAMPLIGQESRRLTSGIITDTTAHVLGGGNRRLGCPADVVFTRMHGLHPSVLHAVQHRLQHLDAAFLRAFTAPGAKGTSIPPLHSSQKDDVHRAMGFHAGAVSPRLPDRLLAMSTLAAYQAIHRGLTERVGHLHWRILTKQLSPVVKAVVREVEQNPRLLVTQGSPEAIKASASSLKHNLRLLRQSSPQEFAQLGALIMEVTRYKAMLSGYGALAGAMEIVAGGPEALSREFGPFFANHMSSAKTKILAPALQAVAEAYNSVSAEYDIVLPSALDLFGVVKIAELSVGEVTEQLRTGQRARAQRILSAAEPVLESPYQANVAGSALNPFYHGWRHALIDPVGQAVRELHEQSVGRLLHEKLGEKFAPELSRRLFEGEASPDEMPILRRVVGGEISYEVGHVQTFLKTLRQPTTEQSVVQVQKILTETSRLLK